MTSIIDIVYNEVENPCVFKLVFQRNEMLLEDVDKGQCKLWVIAITKGKQAFSTLCLCVCVSQHTHTQTYTYTLGLKRMTNLTFRIS